ncbi:MAG: UvrD-helicase domain-containing protein [Candidatus Syntrophosphaera sp.]|nr:UvrD-helicase domain-containing protein [Candidatus Syntrophosphaera sp.]
MAELSELGILSHLTEAEKLFLPNECNFDPESVNFIKCLESTDVVACPGSGKTTALLAKLFILSKYMPFEFNKGICVLTHTNVAIDEIKRRMGKASSVLFTYPNFFGTIQSFVDKFLAIPAFVEEYGHRNVTIDSSLAESIFWKRLKPTTRTWVSRQYIDIIAKLILTSLDEIMLSSDGKTSSLKIGKQTESYKELLSVKKHLIEDGIIRYDEAYLFAENYIAKHPGLPESICTRFSYLFIDEMQDTDKRQNDLLNRVFNDSVVKQRIGDPNQAIYDLVVSDDVAWGLSDKIITISSSQRISNQIAQSIHKVCVKPEASLNGVDRGTDCLLSPVIILYDDDSQSVVLSKFSELIKEREDLWKQEIAEIGKLPLYYAVGWTHDNEGKTAAGLNKTSIRSYFPDYHRPVRSGNPIYNSLKNYLVKSAGSRSNVTPQMISDSLLSSFLRVLSEGDITNPSSGKRYTKSSLYEYLKTHEEFHSEFKSDLALWVKQISKHACDDTTCSHRNDAYPNCVFEQIIQYLKETWLPHFAIEEAQVDRFITNPIEQMENTSSVSNVFSSNGIDIQVGTVHSVKGQTHTATLFLECFSYDFNGNQLLDYLTGDRTFSSNDGKYRNCALKVAYVAMSRPTHFLCAAFHIDRIPTTAHKKLEELGWSLVTI